ncbi:hypothetical protein, partial [Oenococcus oeni]
MVNKKMSRGQIDFVNAFEEKMFKIIYLELKAYWRETSFDKLSLRLIFLVSLTSFFIVYGAGIF